MNEQIHCYDCNKRLQLIDAYKYYAYADFYPIKNSFIILCNNCWDEKLQYDIIK